jgi:TonB family protein
MSETGIDRREWSSRKWVGMVGVIFAVQLGFIFWLGDRKPIRPREPHQAPIFQLAGSEAHEWLSLQDPTLFALPHDQAFSGSPLLVSPNPATNYFEWSEEPHWLTLFVQSLGASFARLVPPPQSSPGSAIEFTEPRWLTPELVVTPLPPLSSLRLDGELAGRSLLNLPSLPAWPPRFLNPTDTDILTNTVVQAVVDREGRPFSMTLLVSSGYPPADEAALSMVGRFRFQPQPPMSVPATNPGSQVLNGLSFGLLIFEWQTLASTNTPPAAQ